MKRRIFTFEKFYNVCKFRARRNASEQGRILTDEELKQEIEKEALKCKEELRVLNVSDKLVELGWGKSNDDYTVYTLAEQLARDFPEEMEQNLNEWLDDKPITEIKYGGYSFKDMNNQYKNIELPFFYYLVYMKAFINDGKKDPAILRNAFLIL